MQEKNNLLDLNKVLATNIGNMLIYFSLSKTSKIRNLLQNTYNLV